MKFMDKNTYIKDKISTLFAFKTNNKKTTNNVIQFRKKKINRNFIKKIITNKPSKKYNAKYKQALKIMNMPKYNKHTITIECFRVPVIRTLMILKVSPSNVKKLVVLNTGEKYYARDDRFELDKFK